MRSALVLSTFSYLAVLGLVACSSDGGGGTGTEPTSGCASLVGVAYEASSACPGKCTPTNDAYCADDGLTNNCVGGPIDNCGVSTTLPPKSGGKPVELTRSADVKEYSGSGAPDLGCFEAANFPSAPDTANSKLVKLSGTVKIFSHGCESKNLTIEIHKVLRGGADDGGPGELVGKAVTTPATCKDVGVPEENKECGTRYECPYEYADVPTETELLVITDGDIWAPIFEYGLFVSNGDVKNGGYTKDVRALASDDYQLIPQVALGKTVTAGHGAIAGEVHDCGDVRLVDAVVDIDQPKFSLSYFTDNEDNPLPDTDARSTSSLGLYSALDVAPGPVTIAAAGIYGGKLVSLGYFKGRVFPDAVTSFTFRGLKAFQLPTK